MSDDQANVICRQVLRDRDFGNGVAIYVRRIDQCNARHEFVLTPYEGKAIRTRESRRANAARLREIIGRDQRSGRALYDVRVSTKRSALSRTLSP